MNDDRAIQPDGLYTVDEAAYRLGFRSKSTKANRNRVHEIPADQLIRTRVGAKRGKVMFFGRDLLAYIERGRQVRKSA